MMHNFKDKSFASVQEIITFIDCFMKTASKELQKLRSLAENSLNKTAEIQQLLAQIEANLSRAEIKKVIEKKGNA